MHIIIRPASDSTIFNFTMIDVEHNFGIVQRESVDGELNEIFQVPVKGSYKLTIDESTLDEDFRVYLAIREI